MTQILRIDSSSRLSSLQDASAEGSYSRWLTDYVIERISNDAPGTQITTRDLAVRPIDHVSDDTIKGYYTPPDLMSESDRLATALSDQLIEEIRNSDVLVISAPIYNFSVPSALKAWIDQVVRIGRTFSYEDGQFGGLINGKKAYLILSYGASGYSAAGPLHSYDFLRPYLTTILNFIGITDVTVFTIEATTAEVDVIAAAKRTAIASVDKHVSKTVTI